MSQIQYTEIADFLILQDQPILIMIYMIYLGSIMLIFFMSEIQYADIVDFMIQQDQPIPIMIFKPWLMDYIQGVSNMKINVLKLTIV